MATDGTCLIPAGPLTLATSVRLREQEMKDEKRGRVVEAEANEKQKKCVGMKDENTNWGKRDKRKKIGKTIDRINVF